MAYGGRYAAGPQSVLTSAARTSSGQSSWFNVEEFDQINFYIDITAISGTNPTMTVKLQESPDQSDAYDLEEIAVEETGNYAIRTNEHVKYIRLRYVISGTLPSITFQADYIGRS